jgi:hypothetical protein
MMMVLIYWAKTKISWKKTNVLLNASEDVGLDSRSSLNAEKSNQTARQNHYIKAANEPIKNVALLKYLRTTVTDQNCTDDEI